MLPTFWPIENEDLELILISYLAVHTKVKQSALNCSCPSRPVIDQLQEYKYFAKMRSSESHWDIFREEPPPKPAKKFTKKQFFSCGRSKSGTGPSCNSSPLVLNDWFFHLGVLDVLLVNISHLGPGSIHYVERSLQAAPSPRQYK